MANKHSCDYIRLSDQNKAEIIAYYLTPKSKRKVTEKFGITVYSLNRILKEMSISREKYGDVRNRMVSQGIKECLQNHPEIVEARIKLHTGSKRSAESKQKMREAAWNGLSKRKIKYISKIETNFGSFIARKFGLKLLAQYRVGNKPFDFLIEDHKILVEFDGPHHYNPDYYLWKDIPDGYQKQQFRDNLRHQIANDNGYKLIVVRQTDVNKNGELTGDMLMWFISQVGY